jgi:hypothetical protein
MKKLLSVLVISATVLFSCSKEAKLNRKIDGEWNVTTVDGVSLSSYSGYESMVFNFEKDKKGKGNVTITTSGTDGENQLQSINYTGTYTLNEDTKINTILNMSSQTDTIGFVVSEYDKKNLKLVDDFGQTYELEKK